MKTKIYLDTSVFGGYFDEEFKKYTCPLFERIENGEFDVYISDILEAELFGASNKIKQLIEKIPQENYFSIKTDEEVLDLATKYIQEDIISKKHLKDTLHIALASVNRIDILISWNYKHIVNLNRIKKYNGVNLMLGYTIIDIVTPSNLISD